MDVGSALSSLSNEGDRSTFRTSPVEPIGEVSENSRWLNLIGVIVQWEAMAKKVAQVCWKEEESGRFEDFKV